MSAHTLFATRRVALLALLLLPILALSVGCWASTTTSYVTYDNYQPSGTHMQVTRTTNWVFYPGADVYYCSARKSWCYHDGGRWMYTTTLPGTYRTRLGNYVTLSYTGETPYVYYETHYRTYTPAYRRHYHRDHNYYHEGSTRTYRESRAWGSTGGYYSGSGGGKVTRYSESRR